MYTLNCSAQSHRIGLTVTLLQFSGEIGCHNSKSLQQESVHSRNVLEADEQDCKSYDKQDNCVRLRIFFFFNIVAIATDIE